MIDPIWKDGQVFIVGAGPSAAAIDFSLLEGRDTLVINRMFEFVRRPRVHFFMDNRIWRWHGPEIAALDCIKITGANPRIVRCEGMIFVKPRGLRGLSLEPGVIRTGNNSAYAAINIAVQLGPPRQIVLLGVDMKPAPDGTMHAHQEHLVPTRPRELEKMKPYFPTLVEPLRELGVEVVNANPDSALETFRKVSLADVL